MLMKLTVNNCKQVNKLTIENRKLYKEPIHNGLKWSRMTGATVEMVVREGVAGSSI